MTLSSERHELHRHPRDFILERVHPVIVYQMMEISYRNKNSEGSDHIASWWLSLDRWKGYLYLRSILWGIQVDGCLSERSSSENHQSFPDLNTVC
ncbi:hypothetical protein [Egbenema bharatensis]|uniref:hypothetical protein n=1 Tax=Egbenema bharatensis TaxID=3463334 RepID=UPI003A8B1547